MLTIGGVLVVLFVIIEWRFARLPMVPCKYNRERWGYVLRG